MLKLTSLLVAAAAFSGAAAAQNPSVVVSGEPTVTVSYADLNLASAGGRAALDRRVRQAARALCVDERVADLERAIAGRACLASALASARPQIEQALAAGGATRLAANRTISVSIRR